MSTGNSIRYPAQLKPTTAESFSLPNGEKVLVPKATPTFRRWDGVAPLDTYGNKADLDCEGSSAFAELSILRTLENVGWEGVWVDTYRKQISSRILER
jgi:hypothetical protein